jgi:cysteine synthase
MQPAVVLEPQLEQRLRALHRLVGNTPLLAVHFTFQGTPRTIYAKCEHLNMTGCMKDRMALYLLEQAYHSGALHPGDTIAEASSGSSGIALAAIGRALGHPVVIFMPDWMSRERRDLLASFGAQVVLTGRDEGGFRGCMERAERLAAEQPGVYLTRQFSNPANVAAHETTTGPEIWWQLSGVGRLPDAFVAGVGTGGTVMGVGAFLKARWRHIQVHPVEPAESPTLTAGRKVGQHRIQGLTDEFIPEIVKLDRLDPVLAVHDGDAILMAQKLASQLGLGVGISSGANFVGALMAQQRLGADAVVATVFPDSNKKYLSTDLLKAEPVRDGYLAPGVELTGMDAVQRVCAVCSDLQR